MSSALMLQTDVIPEHVRGTGNHMRRLIHWDAEAHAYQVWYILPEGNLKYVVKVMTSELHLTPEDGLKRRFTRSVYAIYEKDGKLIPGPIDRSIGATILRGARHQLKAAA